MFHKVHKIVTSLCQPMQNDDKAKKSTLQLTYNKDNQWQLCAKRKVSEKWNTASWSLIRPMEFLWRASKSPSKIIYHCYNLKLPRGTQNSM